MNGPIDQTVAIFMDGVLEVSIDSRRHFGGDFYRYRRAPLILELAPGEHIIEFRLIRDVRALGGQGVPAVNMVFETQIRHEVLLVDESSLLIPETTDQRLGSAWATVNVQSNTAEWVEITCISSPDVSVNVLLLSQNIIS
jgi:hypothetical protein